MRTKLLLLNLLMAILWMFMWGQINIYTMVFGFALGFVLLCIIGWVVPLGRDSYGRKVWNTLSFAAYFMKILVTANLQVAREICTPGFQMTPAFVRYSVEGMTDLQITSFANAITLTPGTLSVDLSADAKYLYVHCMYAKDRQAAISGLDELRDRIMTEVFG